jgi:acyl-CoA synthetase (AMP-forming)/AMP-acid ligase II
MDVFDSKLLNIGFNLTSSGTTGNPKTIYHTPRRLKAANKAGVDAQELTSKSKVLTVCSLNHAGGTTAQSLPALSVGAEVVIKKFNAFTFYKDINGFTHTHLTPGFCTLLMRNKTWDKLDLTGVWITCGSDSVYPKVIQAFVNKGATFMCNWGMTEVGPCAINRVFRPYENIELRNEPYLGNRYYCDWTITYSKELHVKGDIVYTPAGVRTPGWFRTGDLVNETKYGLWYNGRKTEIN